MGPNGEVEQQAAAEEDDEAEEEAVPCRPARDPRAPTAAERVAHEATHLPFRVWCPCCVAGRRDNPPHRRVDGSANEVPEILLDYCFVRRHGEEESLTILLLKGRASRSLRAWAMRRKGLIPRRQWTARCRASATWGTEGRFW